MSKKKTIFHMVSSVNKEKEIIFESSSPIYQEAVQEAVDKKAIEFSGNYTTVKIWSPNLVPEYGPYYYSVVFSNGAIFISNSSKESFNEHNEIPEGTFLGGFNAPDNGEGTPFLNFTKKDWINYFEKVKEFNFYFRNPSSEEVIEYINQGYGIRVIENRYINQPSTYGFQLSNKK